MYFEDGFKYTQDDTTIKIRLLFLSYIKQQFTKKQKNEHVVISCVNLIETVLKRFGISSFDFLNDDSIKKIDTALLEGFKFLTENSLISSNIWGKDKFYKYFLRRELFKSREFSNEFEKDLVLTLIYRLELSFKYLITDDFLEFYKLYTIHYIILTSSKVVHVKLPYHKEVSVLVLKSLVKEKNLVKTLNKYDYSLDYNFIALNNKSKNTIALFSTTEITNKKEQDLFNKLTLAVNVNASLKKEFNYAK